MIAETIDPDAVAELYRTGQEFALVDVREQWAFCRGHALLASSCPLSSLEMMVRDLIPRKGARVVVMDGGEAEGGDLAGRARQRLARLGYSDTRILEGGALGWQRAGFRLFTGVHVFSKLLGEHIEQAHATPETRVAALAAATAAGGGRPPMLIVDVRPNEEYRQSTIPGAVSVPAGELLRTASTLAPDSRTPILVHCGGRTRGIVAAQTLIAAGVDNPVSVLTNGTIGWRLAGFQTAKGTAPPAAAASRAAADARRHAAALLARSPVRSLDAAGMAQALDRAGEFTTYLIDVRSPEEYRAAHFADARNLPAGQLLQELDTAMAVRHGRVVLLDDLGDRAAYAGYWLTRAGWREVSWHSYDHGSLPLVTGDYRPAGGVAETRAACPRVCPIELSALIDEGHARVIDLSSSVAFENGRIPGAFFAIRSRLPERIDDVVPDDALLVVTSEDGRRAEWASHELAPRFGGRLRTLLGGNDGWRSAGMPIEQGAGRYLHPPHDVRRSIYERPDDVMAAMQGYIDWEVSLLEAARGETYLAFDR